MLPCPDGGRAHLDRLRRSAQGPETAAACSSLTRPPEPKRPSRRQFTGAGPAPAARRVVPTVTEARRRRSLSAGRTQKPPPPPPKLPGCPPAATGIVTRSHSLEVASHDPSPSQPRRRLAGGPPPPDVEPQRITHGGHAGGGPAAQHHDDGTGIESDGGTSPSRKLNFRVRRD